MTKFHNIIFYFKYCVQVLLKAVIFRAILIRFLTIIKCILI